MNPFAFSRFATSESRAGKRRTRDGLSTINILRFRTRVAMETQCSIQNRSAPTSFQAQCGLYLHLTRTLSRSKQTQKTMHHGARCFLNGDWRSKRQENVSKARSYPHSRAFSDNLDVKSQVTYNVETRRQKHSTRELADLKSINSKRSKHLTQSLPRSTRAVILERVIPP